MRNRTRWMAFMLALTMVFSDCGCIPAFAMESADRTEDVMQISENPEENLQTGETGTAILDVPSDNKKVSYDETSAGGETGSDDETVSGNDTALENGTEKQEEKAELPELHIGQINKKETFPDPEDSSFVYDQPISFETSDSLILFVNYGIDVKPEVVENGILCWNILRGGKELTAGSTSLINEEDDWIEDEDWQEPEVRVIPKRTEKMALDRLADDHAEDDWI